MVKRVLVVDDDPAQRRILEEMIKRLGYEARVAQGGEPSALNICILSLKGSATSKLRATLSVSHHREIRIDTT